MVSLNWWTPPATCSPTGQSPNSPAWQSGVRPRGRGGLLVLSANPEMDPMVTMFGDRVPGIEGGDNERCCRDTLRLIGELPSPSIFDWTEAYRLLSQIEANCYWITSHTLQRAFGADWWAAAVPEAIRQKCAARKLTEGGQYPDHAYLELMEYKKLWTRHWPLIVGAASTSEGPFPIEKKQAEDVFESIHPIRKKNAHPTKVAAIAQSRPSRSEREVLERAAQLILQAHRSVFGLVGVR